METFGSANSYRVLSGILLSPGRETLAVYCHSWYLESSVHFDFNCSLEQRLILFSSLAIRFQHRHAVPSFDQFNNSRAKKPTEVPIQKVWDLVSGNLEIISTYATMCFATNWLERNLCIAGEAIRTIGHKLICWSQYYETVTRHYPNQVQRTAQVGKNVWLDGKQLTHEPCFQPLCSAKVLATHLFGFLYQRQETSPESGTR